MTKGKSERQIARKYVFEGMELLPDDALTPFVEKRLEIGFGEDWWTRVKQRYNADLEEADRIGDKQAASQLPHRQLFGRKKFYWDQLALLKVMDWLWDDAFKTVLGDAERDIVKELIEVRNKLAHYKRFNYFDAWRALDLMRRLTEAVGAGEVVAKLGAMHNAISCIGGNAFYGFPFGTVNFGYSEGKNVLRLAMEALRERTDLRRKIRIDPRRQGRGAIRNDGGSVWNVLVFKAAPEWRASPHLTLGIGKESVSAMATLPNKASTALRCFKKLDRERFRRMVERVLEKMRPVLDDFPGMEPRLRVRQRRRPSRSTLPMMDAYIDVDLRTYINDQEAAKFHPRWVDAGFDALRNKKSHISLELQIGARFPYRTCPYIAGPDALDCVARAWIACKPYIDVLFERRNAPAA